MSAAAMLRVWVIPDSGSPYWLEATSRDVYQWEKRGKGRSIDDIIENKSIKARYELLHLAAVRKQAFSGTVDEFVDSHDFTFVAPDDEEEGASVPTSGEA